MNTSKRGIGMVCVVLLLAARPVTAAVNNAYADATGASGLTVHTVFPNTLNGTAGDVTGQVLESVAWAPVPSVTLSAASSVAANGASGYADFTYSFTVSDNGAAITTPVPIDVLGNYQLNVQSAGEPGYVTAQLVQSGGVGSFLFNLTSTTAGCLGAGCAGSFSGQALLSVPGSTQVTTLGGTVDLIVNVGVSGIGSAHGFIDPYLTIDPTWAASNPGFTLSTEAGIGNGSISPVPEPSTWMSFAAGLAVMGTCLRRRMAGPAR